MKDEQRVFIRGVEGRGGEVLKMLENRGGRNPGKGGNRPTCIYYIWHNGMISSASIGSETALIIMDFYREIKLPEKWRDGDILVENRPGPVYSVFKSEEGNGKFSEYFCVTDDAIIKANIFRSINKWHLANEEERKAFTNLLHKHHKDWDAEKKQLVNWRRQPCFMERYWFVCNNGETSSRLWGEDEADDELYSFGNYFQTREEAEEAAERVKKALIGE